MNTDALYIDVPSTVWDDLQRKVTELEEKNKKLCEFIAKKDQEIAEKDAIISRQLDEKEKSRCPVS